MNATSTRTFVSSCQPWLKRSCRNCGWVRLPSHTKTVTHLAKHLLSGAVGIVSSPNRLFTSYTPPTGLARTLLGSNCEVCATPCAEPRTPRFVRDGSRNEHLYNSRERPRDMRSCTLRTLNQEVSLRKKTFKQDFLYIKK